MTSRFELAEDTIALFYQGFRVAGGALYFACVDCNSTADRGADIIAVDAHDDTESGDQPAVSLLSSPAPSQTRSLLRHGDTGVSTGDGLHLPVLC